MEPIYIGEDFKEELDSDTYRITQSLEELGLAEEHGLSLYLSALSPADISDFYWADQPVHEEDQVVARTGDFENKAGTAGMRYCLVSRT